MNSWLSPFEEEWAATPKDVPVFPLPEMVLLPGEPMPLHIFEDRYRMMTESAISSEKVIAMACFKPALKEADASKEIYEVAGLGKIVMDEQLTDGRYNLVLLGMKRVRIRRYIQEKPFRRAQIEVLNDRFSETALTVLTSLEGQIVSLARKILKVRGRDWADDSPIPLLEHLTQGSMPLGALCDVIAAALLLHPLEKQMILEEMDVVRRAEKLAFSLQFLLEALKGSSRPPLLH